MTIREIFRLGPKPEIAHYWSYFLSYQYSLVTNKGHQRTVVKDGVYRLPFPITDDATLDNVRSTIAEQESDRFGGVKVVGNMPDIAFIQIYLVDRGQIRLTPEQAEMRRRRQAEYDERLAVAAAEVAAEADARARVEAKARGEEIDAPPSHAADCPNGFGARIQLGEKCDECGAAWIPAPDAKEAEGRARVGIIDKIGDLGKLGDRLDAGEKALNRADPTQTPNKKPVH